MILSLESKTLNGIEKQIRSMVKAMDHTFSYSYMKINIGPFYFYIKIAMFITTRICLMYLEIVDLSMI